MPVLNHMGLIVRVILRRSINVGALCDTDLAKPGLRKRERVGTKLSYARDGDCEIELRCKGEHEDVRGIDFDGGPSRGIGVHG